MANIVSLVYHAALSADVPEDGGFEILSEASSACVKLASSTRESVNAGTALDGAVLSGGFPLEFELSAERRLTELWAFLQDPSGQHPALLAVRPGSYVCTIVLRLRSPPSGRMTTMNVYRLRRNLPAGLTLTQLGNAA